MVSKDCPDSVLFARFRYINDVSKSVKIIYESKKKKKKKKILAKCREIFGISTA